MLADGFEYLGLVRPFVDGEELSTLGKEIALFVLIVENLLDHRLRALVPRRREPFAFEDPRNTNIVVATVDSGVGETEPFGGRELPLFQPDRSRHRVKAAKDQVHVRRMVPAPQPYGLGGQADIL